MRRRRRGKEKEGGEFAGCWKIEKHRTRLRGLDTDIPPLRFGGVCTGARHMGPDIGRPESSEHTEDAEVESLRPEERRSCESRTRVMGASPVFGRVLWLLLDEFRSAMASVPSLTGPIPSCNLTGRYQDILTARPHHQIQR